MNFPAAELAEAHSCRTDASDSDPEELRVHCLTVVWRTGLVSSICKLSFVSRRNILWYFFTFSCIYLYSDFCNIVSKYTCFFMTVYDDLLSRVTVQF